MIEISNVFQQYTNEYILAEPGSPDEETYFGKIESTYAKTFAVDSSLLLKFYVGAFIDTLRERNNKEHLERFERMLEDIEEIKNESIAVAYFKTKEKETNLMREEIKKLRNAFPVHVSKPLGTTSLINPFEEFEAYCIDKYFDKFKNVQVTCRQFNEMSIDERVSLIRTQFADNEKVKVEKFFNETEQQNEISVKLENRDGEFEEVLVVAVSPSTFVVKDSSNGEALNTISVDFRMNDAFDYLFDPQATSKIDPDPKATLSGQIYFVNDLRNSNVQLSMTLSLIEGFLNFSDYKRFHKKTSIIMNGISRYVETKFENAEVAKLTFGYDCAYIVYTPDKKYDSKATKISRISYDSYSDDIDKFLTEIGK